MMTRISYTKPSITELEVQYATDAARTGWGDRCYDYINRFEQEFAAHLCVKYAIATSSCTGALHLGFSALGIGANDEVILADTNWIATAAPLVHIGAKPVFVDILPDTWCIDPQAARRAITPKTKAIIATHIYGNLCDMDALQAICDENNLILIEDAAEAIGSEWRGKRAGSLAKFGVFSFHGTKTMTTGEGGMFVTDDVALFEKVTTLSNHGRSKSQTKQFWPDMVGFKYKMSNIQAAIGLAQVQRIDELISRKIAIIETYRSLLSEYSDISLNPECPVGKIGGWMPTAVFSNSSGVSRERLQELFAAQNIDARVFFWPLSSLPYFEQTHKNPNAYDIPNRSINLPSYHDMTLEEQQRVVAVLVSALND